MENNESRVNFPMAEALAFGSLALHKGVQIPGASCDINKATEGLNKGAYAVSCFTC